MAENKVKITLVKSTIGTLKSHKATVAALGLHKIGQTVVKENTPALQGMLAKVGYLVKTENV